MSGKYPWDFATVSGLISAKFPEIKFMEFPEFAFSLQSHDSNWNNIIIYDIRTNYELLLFQCFSASINAV